MQTFDPNLPENSQGMFDPGNEQEIVSNCCGARMFNGICMNCKEHCSPEEPEEIPGFEGTNEKLKNLILKK